MSSSANSVVRLVLHSMAWSARQGSILLAVGIFGGIVSPALAREFKVFVTPTVLILMTCVLLRVDIQGTLVHVRRPGRAVVMVVLQMLAAPVVAWAVTLPLHLDAGIAAGVVIFATGCAAASSAAFARLVGLDPEISLVVTLMSLALVPFTAPTVALIVLGIDLSIGTAQLMVSLLIIVGLPLVLSLAIRWGVGRDGLARHGQAIDGFTVWMVVFYGFAVMDGLQARMAADPAWVVQALIAAFAVDYGLNFLTTLVLAPWGFRSAASAGLMSGNRNMALYLAVLPATTDPRIVLFFGLCQIPLFLSPFLLRPAYRALGGWRAMQ